MTFEFVTFSADAEAEQEDERDREPADRHEQAQRLGARRAAAQADPQHAAEQVDQQRIGERDRDVDAPVVEEGEREPKRSEHEQVEVQQPQRPARVDERRDEQHDSGIQTYSALTLRPNAPG